MCPVCVRLLAVLSRINTVAKGNLVLIHGHRCIRIPLDTDTHRTRIFSTVTDGCIILTFVFVFLQLIKLRFSNFAETILFLYVKSALGQC